MPGCRLEKGFAFAVRRIGEPWASHPTLAVAAKHQASPQHPWELRASASGGWLSSTGKISSLSINNAEAAASTCAQPIDRQR